MRTHVLVYIEEEVNVCCLSQLFYTLFFETGSHTIWSSPIQPHSLVNKPQGSSVSASIALGKETQLHDCF